MQAELSAAIENLNEIFVGMLQSPFRDNPIQKKIESFGELKKGWHFGEGIGPSSETLRDALALHASILANGFKKTGAFPGIGGEIRITIYDESDYHEFTFEDHGTLTYLHETNGVEDLELPNLDLTGARTLIANLKIPQLEWSSLESSRPNTTLIPIINPQSFKIWPSNELMGQSQFSLKSVQSSGAAQ